MGLHFSKQVYKDIQDETTRRSCWSYFKLLKRARTWRCQFRGSCLVILASRNWGSAIHAGFSGSFTMFSRRIKLSSFIYSVKRHRKPLNMRSKLLCRGLIVWRRNSMANKKTMMSFKSAEELARSLSFTKVEAEIIAMKGTVIGLLDKERQRRGFNNTEFAAFLGVPKSRWSSIFSSPEKVTLDYLLTLAAKCGTLYKLTRKTA